MIRGIRGAITVEENTEAAISQATNELLRQIIAVNDLYPADISSVFATMTDDLNAAFPAKAIRAIQGWEPVPIMCAQEIPVPGSISMCIRVLIHVNTDKSQTEMRHVYLKRAINLRPDLALKS